MGLTHPSQTRARRNAEIVNSVRMHCTLEANLTFKVTIVPYWLLLQVNEVDYSFTLYLSFEPKATY